MALKFRTKVGAQITNQECEDSSARFWASNKHFNVKWAYIGKDAILELLRQNPSEIAGIKIIPGIDKEGKPQINLSTVNQEGELITSFDYVLICPPICPPRGWKVKKTNGAIRFSENNSNYNPV